RGALIFAAAISLLNAAQAQDFRPLYGFTGGNDGEQPSGGLIRDGLGNLYRNALAGGGYGAGTVYKLDKDKKITVVHSFSGNDGAAPVASLTRDNDGNLYGVTDSGGRNNLGTVFKLSTSGNLTVLHSFAGPDGANPNGSVTLDGTGN